MPKSQLSQCVLLSETRFWVKKHCYLWIVILAQNGCSWGKEA